MGGKRTSCSSPPTLRSWLVGRRRGWYCRASPRQLRYVCWNRPTRWLGRQDLNLRMPVPKTGALPLGDAPAGGPSMRGRRAYSRRCAPRKPQLRAPRASLLNARSWPRTAFAISTRTSISTPISLIAPIGSREAARARFGVPIGRFHTAPVGPHPRGSCQLDGPARAVRRLRAVDCAQSRRPDDLRACEHRRRSGSTIPSMSSGSGRARRSTSRSSPKPSV